MKKYLTTIIALIIIGVVLAGYFIAKGVGVFDPKPEPTEVPVETGYVLVFPEGKNIPGDIVGIECKYGETVSVRKIASEWECTSHPEISVVSKNVSYYLNACQSCPGRVVYKGNINEDARQNFGVTDDSDYITYTLADGSEYTIRFGLFNTTGSSVYSWQEGSDTIYLLDNLYRKAMSVTPIGLISTKIFTFADNGQINKITIYKNGVKEMEFEASFNTEAEDIRSWNMKSPLVRGGNRDKIENLITTVTSIKIADFIEPNCQNMADYGLSPAAFKISIRDPNGTTSLSIGKKTEDGVYYYASVDDSNDVYLIEAASVTFKDETALTFMDRAVYMVYYTEIDTVEMNLLGEEHLLKYESEDTTDTFHIDGQNVVFGDFDFSGDFKRIGTAMYSLDITNLEDEPETKGELLCSLKYTLQDGSVHLVECFERDETTMWFYLNGEYVGGYGSRYVLTADADNYGIRGTLYALLNEMEAAKG